MESKISLVALGEPRWSKAVLPALRVWQDYYIEWTGRNSLGINENLYFMLLYMYTVLYKTAVQIPKIDLLELSVLLDCSSKED